MMTQAGWVEEFEFSEDQKRELRSILGGDQELANQIEEMACSYYWIQQARRPPGIRVTEELRKLACGLRKLAAFLDAAEPTIQEDVEMLWEQYTFLNEKKTSLEDFRNDVEGLLKQVEDGIASLAETGRQKQAFRRVYAVAIGELLRSAGVELSATRAQSERASVDSIFVRVLRIVLEATGNPENADPANVASFVMGKLAEKLT